MTYLRICHDCPYTHTHSHSHIITAITLTCSLTHPCSQTKRPNESSEQCECINRQQARAGSARATRHFHKIPHHTHVNRHIINWRHARLVCVFPIRIVALALSAYVCVCWYVQIIIHNCTVRCVNVWHSDLLLPSSCAFSLSLASVYPTNKPRGFKQC